MRSALRRSSRDRQTLSVAASRWARFGRASRGLLLIGAGAVVASAGVGLAPHLLGGSLTTMSVSAVAALLAGICALGAGARSLLRDRPRLMQLAGGAATLLLLAITVSIIAPAVAATSVPPTEVAATPAALGLAHESVVLTTTDGVELAAWYVHGTNGAGLVVMHGAGSTRSDVLDQAEVLVVGGYSVVLIDARGHGESRGKAMDFGWFGDLDIAAGTAFLASRPEIDDDRIGVVGLSMGAEEAIGAAASDPLIRAVVAEGATGRAASDKEWFSEAYGWRGWLQERLEHLQYSVTDLLTDASPPISLRSAVSEAAETEFLLIAAGNVADEGRAASYIRSGAIDRVTVWVVDGADHTSGLDARPDEWRRRVLGFLDARLT